MASVPHTFQQVAVVLDELSIAGALKDKLLQPFMVVIREDDRDVESYQLGLTHNELAMVYALVQEFQARRYSEYAGDILGGKVSGQA